MFCAWYMTNARMGKELLRITECTVDEYVSLPPRVCKYCDLLLYGALVSVKNSNSLLFDEWKFPITFSGIPVTHPPPTIEGYQLLRLTR